MVRERYGGTVYRFGSCEFQPDTQTLRVAGKALVLKATPFRVLVTLIERAGQIVPRGEMIDAIWGDKIVEENNLSVQVSAVRKALGPERDAIRTFPGLGYRFSAALDGAHPAAPAEAPPAIVGRRQGNVPATLPQLFGREQETRDVIDRLKARRIVTILGAGGMGKTSLALAVADRVRADYPDGVWLVELASLSLVRIKPWKLERRVSEICALIGRTLGLKLPKTGGRLQHLTRALATRKLLLVLDNCEHLDIAASTLVQALLHPDDGVPTVRLLATSQVQISGSVPDDQLGPLLTPAAGDREPLRYAAMQLLVARIRDIHPRFVLDAENTRQAIELCERLEGMPLAIELAASRVRFMGLSDVCERLGKLLDLLARKEDKTEARHLTLMATMDWSHALLKGGAPAVFRRCSVFQGGFTLDAAEKVLVAEGEDRWQAIEDLAILVERSLVSIERSEPLRYRMLETTRSYAEVALAASDESDATSARHAKAFCERFEASLDDEWQLKSQDRLERYMPDLDNGRTALRWSARKDPALYIRLTGAIAWLLDAAGRTVEGKDHCRVALELLSDHPTPHLAQARLGEAIALLHHSGFGPEAMAGAWLAVRSRRRIVDAERPDDRDAKGRLLPEPKGMFLALGRFAIAASLYGKPRRGRWAVNHMERIEQEDDWPWLSHWERMQADDYVSNQLGEHKRAWSIGRRELAWATLRGDHHKTMFATLALQQCAAARRRRKFARALALRLVEMANQHRFVKSRHIYIYNLAVELTLTGALDEALPWARVASDEDRRNGSLDQELDLMAKLATLRGRWGAAAVIVGRSQEACRRRRQKREPVEAILHEEVLGQLRGRPDWRELDALRVKGVSLKLDDAVSLALDDDARAVAALFDEVKRKLDEAATNRAAARAVRTWKKAQQAVVEKAT